ncbi:hypothetical protein IFR05_015960 [Cadophora sp. M221]|nr:hypothetical protein IFR05_015960 [Cadophora sp. M221]
MCQHSDVVTAPTSCNLCAWCGTPTSKFCGGCKGVSVSLDQTTTKTYYCNRRCQRRHWPEHKSTCIPAWRRAQLYRAGDFLQAIFYQFREITFHQFWEKIEYRDNKRMLLFNPPPRGILNPQSLKDMCRCRSDELTVLTKCARTDVVAWMAEVAKYVLKGVASEIYEISVRPKDPSRKLMIMLGTGMEDQSPAVIHQPLRVQLNESNEVFALDLSSAQYGYYDSVAPFGTYVAERASNFLSERTRDLGCAKAEEMRQVQYTLIKGNRILRKRKISDRILPAVTRFEGSTSKTMKGMLKKGKTEWDDWSGELLEQIDIAMLGPDSSRAWK